jgi:hypothetical protein
METPYQSATNLQRLQQAGIINPDAQFPDPDKAIIENLSSAEVDSLISIGGKLGRDFLLQYGGGPTAGILF